jgi:hypothetical protein
MPSFSGTTPTDSVETQIIADSIPNTGFGYMSIISSDGSTFFVTMPYENTQRGAVYVYTLSSGQWVKTQILTASDGAADDYFGYLQSIAISSDGNTLLVGAAGVDTYPYTNNGAVYVFTRSGGVWIEQAKLLASDRADNDSFGFSVALSSDGNTAIVGAPYEDTSPEVDSGAAYVFTRSSGVWTQQAKLTPTTNYTNRYAGYSVALSPNGNTAYVGAPSGGGVSVVGEVCIFTRSGVSWSGQVSSLTASDSSGDDFFGFYIRVSSDGTTLVISNSAGNVNSYIFSGSGTSWTEIQKVVSDFNDVTNAALSSDGSVILFNIPQYSRYIGNAYTFFGAVYVYIRSGGAGGSYSLQEILTASDSTGTTGSGLTASADNYGNSSLAISGDGSTALVGASTRLSNIGAIYVYSLGRALDNKLYSYNSTSGVWNVSGYGELQSSTTYRTSTSGTWTVPVGAKAIEVTCVGAGGGGGRGARNSSSTTLGGGAGGGGGGISRYLFRAEDLGGAGASVTLTVGVNGSGSGVGATGTTALAGIAGISGGNTTFGSYLYAGGGGGGAGGVISGTTSTGGGIGGVGMFRGNSGRDYGSTSAASTTFPGAGGGGCGLGGTSTYRTGTVSNASNLTAATTGVGPTDSTYAWGGGGGAGEISSTGSAGYSFDGGQPGGGGGGGGEGSTGGASGAGGAGGTGGTGSIKITVWYG